MVRDGKKELLDEVRRRSTTFPGVEKENKQSFKTQDNREEKQDKLVRSFKTTLGANKNNRSKMAPTKPRCSFENLSCFTVLQKFQNYTKSGDEVFAIPLVFQGVLVVTKIQRCPWDP